MKNKLRFTISLYFLSILFSANLSATEKRFVLDNTRYLALTNALTDREHEIIVWLPPSYVNSTSETYPVLYFLDAYWDMPLLHSIHGQLAWDKSIPELIMVGFSYNTSAENIGDFRARDFSPTNNEAYHAKSGDGPSFLSFIKNSVIPRVEADYRIDSTQRALAGSSYGGLFTLYAMYTNPELFKRYISISPYVSFDNNVVAKLDEAYAKKHKDLPVRLFLSVGGEEYAPFADPIRDYQAGFKKRAYQNLQVLNYDIQGERHAGVKAEGYSRGLRWVFADISPKEASGLQSSHQGN